MCIYIYISITKWDSCVVITVDRYFLSIASRMYMQDHTVVQTKVVPFLYSPSHLVVIIASCLDVCGVLTVHNILYIW